MAAQVWKGTTSTDWNTGSNWVSGNVPSSGDTVSFGNGTGFVNNPCALGSLVTTVSSVSMTSYTSTLDLGSGTINLGATSGTVWTGAGTITPGTGTIAISTTSASTRTFAGGGTIGTPITYGTLTYTVAGSTGGLTITGTNSFIAINFSDSSNARTLTVPVAPNQTIVTTTLNINGTSGKLMTIAPSTGSTEAQILYNGPGTPSLNYLSVSYSTVGQSLNWLAGTTVSVNGQDCGWTGVVSSDGYIFLAGGGSPSATNTVYSCKINADATMGSWNSTTVIPVNRFGHNTVIKDGYIYVISGDDGSAVVNTTYYAPIVAGGTITAATWATTTTVPTSKRFAFAFTADGYMFSIGGINHSDASPTTEVAYAVVNANGTLGSWTTSGQTQLPVSKAYHSGAFYNNNVYVVGGYNGSYLATVYYASVNSSSGIIGTWNAGTSLPEATVGATCVAANGYLYAFGGQLANGNYGAIQRASIAADGSIGSWTPQNAYSIPTARGNVLYYNNYVYVYGGTNSSTRAVYGRLYDSGFNVLYANTTSTDGGHNYGWNFSAPVTNQLPMMGVG